MPDDEDQDLFARLPETHGHAADKRDQGIQRAWDGADADWRELAYETIVEHLRTHPTFFCDEIWEAGLPFPREARALGPVVLKVSKAGFMVKSGQYRPSVHSNLLEKPVWRSLIYQGSEAAA